MTAQSRCAPLRPVRTGPIAAEILGFDGDAEVIAVFERCFYVAAPGGIICVGVAALGDGPLNVLFEAGPAPGSDWAQYGIADAIKGRVANRRLRLGETFAADLNAVAVWMPPPWPSITHSKISASLAALRPLAQPLCPPNGLGPLIFNGTAAGPDATARAAAPVLADLAASLDACLARDTLEPRLARAATLLVGLGPGLTPSGDDLLGGVLVTLSALGLVHLRDSLWESIEPELDMLTVDISGAHLAAAADGLAAAAVHAALQSILAGDTLTLPGHLSALRAIGHSSGFDTLAGIVLTLESAVAVAVLPKV